MPGARTVRGSSSRTAGALRWLAWADIQFNMLTQAGRETFEVVRDLGELGQWSYGYDQISADYGEAPDGSGKRVQFLRKLKVHEVSPVLVGAGIHTMTTDAKDAAAQEYARYVRSLHSLDPERDEAAARATAVQEYLRFIQHQLTA
jgi:hypothetical protein